MEIILLKPMEGELADPAKNRLFKTLCRVLGGAHPILALGRERLLRQPGEALLLWETEGLAKLESPAPLLILEGPCAPLPPTLPENTIVLFNSRYPQLALLLKGRELQALSCGLQTTDTLTLSSCTQESAVISLQRTLTTFSGETVEPGEFPVKLSGPTDPFAILSVAATYLLGDRGHLLPQLSL